MTEHKDHDDQADVVALPPLVYLGFFLVGVGVQYIWKVKLLSQEVQVFGGLGLIVLSFVITKLAIPEFRKAGTTVDVYKPTDAIITTGAYRFSRNPIYLALAVMHMGLAVLIDNLWAALMLIPTLVVMSHGVIAREEAYLELKFGQDYRNYKSAVRRWL